MDIYTSISMSIYIFLSVYLYVYMWYMCFEHSSDISCSLLVNPSHTDESWAGRNTCLWLNKRVRYFIYHICLRRKNWRLRRTFL